MTSQKCSSIFYPRHPLSRLLTINTLLTSQRLFLTVTKKHAVIPLCLAHSFLLRAILVFTLQRRWARLTYRPPGVLSDKDHPVALTWSSLWHLTIDTAESQARLFLITKNNTKPKAYIYTTAFIASLFWNKFSGHEHGFLIAPRDSLIRSPLKTLAIYKRPASGYEPFTKLLSSWRKHILYIANRLSYGPFIFYNTAATYEGNPWQLGATEEM